MIEKRFASWLEFDRHLDAYFGINALSRRGYWFRGQARSSWPLRSTLDRFIATAEVPSRDAEIRLLLDEFATQVRGLHHVQPPTDEEQLRLLARHAGLPSTIIDWTKSPYVAAFFAFADPILDEKSDDNHVAVWSIVIDEAMRHLGEDVTFLEPELSAVVNPRAVEQQAVFMDCVQPMDIEERAGPALRKFLIPVSARDHVLQRLDAMGITWRTLFRDVDAAARTAIHRVRTLRRRRAPQRPGKATRT